MTDAELIEQLRRAAGIWFKNSDLLLLEELVKRYRLAQQEIARRDRVSAES
jgi:hypothetical protein